MTDPTPHPDPAVALTADEARQAIIESLSWRESLGVGRWGHEVATAILDDYLAARTADAADRLAAVRAREVADLLAVHRLYGEDGDDYYECGCGEWTPADCMERDFGDLLWHEDHVASLIAALSTAPDAGQREAQGRAEPLVEFLTGMRGYIPPAREGESFGVCDVCRDIECGGACPDALLVVRQVIEALDNEDDREYVRDEFRDQGLPLARADRSPDA